MASKTTNDREVYNALSDVFQFINPAVRDRKCTKCIQVWMRNLGLLRADVSVQVEKLCFGPAAPMMSSLSAEEGSKDAPKKTQTTMPSDHQSRYTKGELIGQGAQKKVYKAFDEELGLEVAWNEVAVAELAWTSEKDRDRIFSEIRVLKQLKHKNIITLHDWWFDPKISSICFITELFTDGTLRQYRRKHRNVDLVVLKRWAWQILQGLVYLHGHNPPIIHRDLKSDNIFVNGSSGVVKIGDLGFATMRAGLSMAMSVIGTPEFMAPELYEESYNEKVDVYSFGMCLLELDTLEYPYAECKNAAQIFKKVTSGMPPAGLDKVSCEELKTFISTCICHDPSKRPEARQLLKHPFFDCMRCVGGGAGVLGGLGPPVKSGVSLSAMSSQSALGGGTRGSSPADSHGHPSPVAGQRVHLPLPPSTASSGALGEQVAAAAAASVPHGLSRLAHATPPVLQPMERTGSLSMFPPSTSPGAAGGHMGSALPDPYGGPSPPVGAISASLGGRAASAAALTLPEVGQPGSLAPTPGSGLISASVRGSLCGASGPELQHLAGAGSQGLGAAAEQLQAAGALRRGGSSNGTAHGGTGTTSPLSSPLMQSPFSSSVAAPYPQSHGQPERQCSLDLDLNEGDVLFASDRGAPVASMHSDDVEGPLGERPVRSPSECDDAAGSRAGSSWVPIPAAGSGRMQSWSEDAGADDTALGLGEGPGSGAPGTSAASSLRPDLSMRLNMSCHQTQDDGLLSFSLSFVNHSGLRKKVGFLYNLDEDHPVQIANEMVENLSLKMEEAEFIAQMIQHEVHKYLESSGEGGPPSGSPSMAALAAAAAGGGGAQQQQQQQQLSPQLSPKLPPTPPTQFLHQHLQQQGSDANGGMAAAPAPAAAAAGPGIGGGGNGKGLQAELGGGTATPPAAIAASPSLEQLVHAPYQEDEEDVPSCFF